MDGPHQFKAIVWFYRRRTMWIGFLPLLLHMSATLATGGGWRPRARSGGGMVGNEFRLCLRPMVTRWWRCHRREIRPPCLVLVPVVFLCIVGRHVEDGVSPDLVLRVWTFLCSVRQWCYLAEWTTWRCVLVIRLQFRPMKVDQPWPRRGACEICISESIWPDLGICRPSLAFSSSGQCQHLLLCIDHFPDAASTNSWVSTSLLRWEGAPETAMSFSHGARTLDARGRRLWHSLRFGCIILFL